MPNNIRNVFAIDDQCDHQKLFKNIALFINDSIKIEYKSVKVLAFIDAIKKVDPETQKKIINDWEDSPNNSKKSSHAVLFFSLCNNLKTEEGNEFRSGPISKVKKTLKTIFNNNACDGRPLFIKENLKVFDNTNSIFFNPKKVDLLVSGYMNELYTKEKIYSNRTRTGESFHSNTSTEPNEIIPKVVSKLLSR